MTWPEIEQEVLRLLSEYIDERVSLSDVDSRVIYDLTAAAGIAHTHAKPNATRKPKAPAAS